MDLTLYVQNFLQQNDFLALATCNADQPYVCHLHYVSDDQLHIYFASKSTKQHSFNIEKNGQVAVCIYDHEESGDSVVSGIQLRGTCEKCEAKDVRAEIKLYQQKFPGKWQNYIDEIIYNPEIRMLYKITPKWIRVINGNLWGEAQEIEL